MVLYLFLNEKNLHASRNKLKGNPRIVKFDPATLWMKGLRTPSPPYSSLEELVKNDKQFRAFKKEKPTTWRKLTEPGNIVDMTDMVLATDRD